MQFHRYKLLVIGAVIALIVYMTTIVNDIDLFERIAQALVKLEKYEVDEFIFPALIILVFAYANEIIWKRDILIEHEKLKIYKAMVWSSQHVLNNFLNQMILFRLTAEDTPNFDSKVLAMFDEIMIEAEGQIKALSNVSNLEENEIRNSVAHYARELAK